MKRIKSKMKVLEWQQHFSHCKSLVIIPDAQQQPTPDSQVRAERNSIDKLIQTVMVVSITCKNEEDPIKNESARVVTTSNINFQALKGS